MKTLTFLTLLTLAACSTQAQPAIVGTPPQPTPGPTITWDAVLGATNYVVAGSTDGTNWTWYYNTNNPPLMITNIPVASSTYFFRGAGQFTNGQGQWTAPIQWTPPPALVNFK